MRTVRALFPLLLLVGAPTAPLARAQSSSASVTVLRLAQGVSMSRDSCRRATAEWAHQALPERRWSEAVMLWEDALAAHGEDAEHWQAYGDALYNAARYRESIAAFERAMLLGGAERQGAWDVARAYARLDKSKQALRWLGTALERGERSAQAARQEPAFARLRDDRQFRDLTEAGGASRHAPARPRHHPVTVAAG